MWNAGRTGRSRGAALALALALLAAACSDGASADGPDRSDAGRAGPDARGDGAAGPDSGFAGTFRPGSWIGIKPGTFHMGSPSSEPCRDPDEDRHAVTISRAFSIAQRETTQRQFRSLMGYNPAFHTGCDACPVESISWHEAAAYCNRASRAEQRERCYSCSGTGAATRCTLAVAELPACKGYRLPTEAEWEYAARAGATTALHNGGLVSCMSTDGNAGKIAWYKVNSGGETHPVGGKSPNAWSLHDMAGGVHEWVHDWYRPHLGTGAATDPTGPAAGTERVFRGGAWYFNAEHARSASRERFAPDKRFTFVGVRCARTL